MTEQQLKAQRDYVNGMKYKDIADKHGVSLNTVKSWKKRHAWSRKKGAHKNKDGVHPKKPGAPLGNGNAIGNKGGAPKGNSNAVSHGLFAKYLPAETLELVEHFENEDQIAKLKRNIAIQEAAIIRSQKIMYVDDKNELIKELKKKQKGNVSGEEWEIQFAWDRQGNYLNSLSRAMTTLVSMYKQLDELTRDSGEDVQTSIGSFVDALKDNVEDVWDDEQE